MRAPTLPQNVNTVAYWDEVYRGEWESGQLLSRRDHGPMHDVIVRLVPEGSSVLDLGCGPGILCRKLRERVDGTRVIGVDFSPYVVARNRERDAALGIEYACLDVRTALRRAGGPFDVVTMCELIEHLDEPERVVAEAVGLVRPGGTFILSCPHDDEVPHPEHVRTWGHDEIYHLLAPYATEVAFYPIEPPRQRWLVTRVQVRDRFARRELLSGAVDVRALFRARGPAEYRVLTSKTRSDDEKGRARNDEFVVFPTIAASTLLRPPVDWTQDPFASRSWRAQLHTLRFLDVLFQGYLSDGDLGALDQARELAFDWIAHNDPAAHGVSEYAWFDRLVGDRAPYLAYLLSALAREDRISTDAAVRLLASIVQHADFLVDDANYVAGTNHGLFEDAGLLLITSYVPFLEDAARWRRHAIARFADTLRRQVDPEEAVHLEHSPSYHTDVTALAAKVCSLASVDDQGLSELIPRLTANAGWFVMPDGNLPPVGDTDLSRAPAFARKAAEERNGLKLFPASGWAMVREDDAYLIVSSGYHSRAHKHADELSFCLFDRGELVITETGKYGYDEDDRRAYALSSRAHNVVLVDDADFSFLQAKPYGSGIRRGGACGGWYAIEASNELLPPAGVAHRRFFLFRPGLVLVVVDELAADERHTYMRLFHVGPGVEVARRNGWFELRASGFAGSLTTIGPAPSDQRLVRGETEPRLRGWTFPTYRSSQEISTIELESAGSHSLLGTAIALVPGRLEGEVRGDATGGLRLSIGVGGLNGAVALEPDGERLGLVVSEAA